MKLNSEYKIPLKEMKMHFLTGALFVLTIVLKQISQLHLRVSSSRSLTPSVSVPCAVFSGKVN